MTPYPSIVHFPIAFITFYSLLELISVKFLERKPYWFYIKAITIFAGTLSAVVAVVSSYYTNASTDVASSVLSYYYRFSITSIALSIFVSLLYLITRFGTPRLQGIAWKMLSNRGAMIPISLALLVLISICSGLVSVATNIAGQDPLVILVSRMLGI